MEPSVPNTSEVQSSFVATLVDEWIRLGLREVVICPGSRSTPLALGFSVRSEVRRHVRLDERGAAFFALGRALESGRPVAVVVTSGTAAAELHAAVAEADQADVPLLVLTADRPPELHGVGAPQTMPQVDLYGPAVRRHENPGVARAEASSSWRPLASRAWRAARGSGTGAPGPVHVNLAFVEPLVVESGTAVPGRPGDRPWTEVGVASRAVSDDTRVAGRVLAVVGRGVGPEWIDDARARGWAVIGDATAQGTLPYFDALLRGDDVVGTLRPDVVVRLGGAPASKWLGVRLREWSVPVVGWTGAGVVSDPDGLLAALHPGWPDLATERVNPDYAGLWSRHSRRVDEWVRAHDDGDLVEPIVARAVVDVAARHQAPLVLGSSMPVRDVEWWASPRRSRTYSNRGVNGIDGVVSTFCGVASAGTGLGLVGDLTALHDVGALVDGLSGSATGVLVVADNGGGGIFSFLSQAERLDGARFEELFGTPRAIDLVAVASAFGHRGARVRTRGELDAALDAALATPGLHVVVADVPTREENVRVHDRWVDAALRAARDA